MRIAVGSDHHGVTMRAKIIDLLRELGQEVVDMGANGGEDVDYPDVAAVVAFLASSAADYITGQVITVDGGMTLGGKY